MKARGFTLLEVLVALAIVSLGMIAVFGQINQSVAGASHLRNKTLAHWIALDQITELRIKNEFPAVGEHSKEIEMAHALWRYTVKISETPADNLRRIDVSVAFEDTPDSVLSTATGFIAPPSPNPLAANLPVGGWLPLDPNNLPTQGITN